MRKISDMSENDIAFLLLCLDHLDLMQEFSLRVATENEKHWKEVMEEFIIEHPEVLKLKEDHEDME